MTNVHASWPNPKVSSCIAWRRHPCGRRHAVSLGRLSGAVSCRKPRCSRGLFIGHDFYRLRHLPDCAPAKCLGVCQGDLAGRCFSLLGSQPVLAGSAPGNPLQRHCHRALCTRRFSRDCRLAAIVAGQLVWRILRRVMRRMLRRVVQERASLSVRNGGGIPGVFMAPRSCGGIDCERGSLWRCAYTPIQVSGGLPMAFWNR